MTLLAQGIELIVALFGKFTGVQEILNSNIARVGKLPLAEDVVAGPHVVLPTVVMAEKHESILLVCACADAPRE